MSKLTRKKLKEGIEAYFSGEESVRSLAGLALSLGTDSRSLSAMLAGGPFADQLERAKTRIEKEIVENGLKGKYNATMSSFLLKTVFGYSEKTSETAGDVKIEMTEELKKFAV